MSYKVIGLIILLLIAVVSTAAAFEFTVSYNEDMSKGSVQFPGVNAMKGEEVAKPTPPEGTPDEIIDLGKVLYYRCEGKDCCVTILRNGTRIPCVLGDCNCCKSMVFDGTGNYVGNMNPDTNKLIKPDPKAVKNAKIEGPITAVKPIGTLLVYKKGNKKIRYFINGNGDNIGSSKESAD